MMRVAAVETRYDKYRNIGQEMLVVSDTSEPTQQLQRRLCFRILQRKVPHRIVLSGISYEGSQRLIAVVVTSGSRYGEDQKVVITKKN